MNDDFVEGSELTGKSGNNCMEQNGLGDTKGHLCGRGEKTSRAYKYGEDGTMGLAEQPVQV